MYEHFFGLNESPFSVNPDPRYLFVTNEMHEAFACLRYGIESRRGFILLTGEVGTGKTTILNKLLDWIHERSFAAAFIFNPRLNVGEFFHFMMADFGIRCEPHSKSDALLTFNQWLLQNYERNERAVLIIDEAQHLSFELLEEIRLLTNLETPTDKLLQIVLAGQPELAKNLSDPRVRQLRQRITLRAKTLPLTLEETHGYMRERLRIAGGPVNIFTTESIDAIHRYSRGIPRVINLLSEHALISSYVDHEKPVSRRTVDAVAEELGLIESAMTDVAQLSLTFHHAPQSHVSVEPSVPMVSELNFE